MNFNVQIDSVFQQTIDVTLYITASIKAMKYIVVCIEFFIKAEIETLILVIVTYQTVFFKLVYVK
jgi:hypothetical protein